MQRGIRRIAVTVALLPLVALLAWRLPRIFTADPLLILYGVTVLAGTIALLFIAYTRYDDPSERKGAHRPRDRDTFPPLATRPSVTLLMAVKDEAEDIEKCVRSMVTSDYPELQVIVIDDGSSDGTVEILRNLEGPLEFLLLALPQNVGKKHALTRGAHLATGDILAFTDSDCVLERSALSRCVRALVLHPELGAVSGHARALNRESSMLARIQDVWYEGQFRVMKAAEATFGSVTCVSGPMAVFRRDAVFNYLPAWAEDRFLGGEFRFATDRQLTGYVLGQRWAGRALKQAHSGSPFLAVDYPEREWRVGYVRSARVWTNVPESIRAFYKQQIRWKKSFIRNCFFTGRFMWRRGPGPAALYYGHVLWVLAAPVMAVRHLIWAPLSGLWLLSGLYLCGVTLKGCAYGLAYKFDNRGDPAWCLRPLMSLISSLTLSWMLVYSALTIRRGIWSRTS
ncbi:glycosyltransferase family 2 protein [Tomitella fengzijianii]|uniref:glycosyltransferase family 2 protein n=1 Tax=Tomitella fengzijianii TaxID=2597660 RepID=UPI001F1E4678|nr:glycosyltransferase [Tomitella fengzijianii]